MLLILKVKKDVLCTNFSELLFRKTPTGNYVIKVITQLDNGNDVTENFFRWKMLKSIE